MNKLFIQLGRMSSINKESVKNNLHEIDQKTSDKNNLSYLHLYDVDRRIINISYLSIFQEVFYSRKLECLKKIKLKFTLSNKRITLF